jgi:hypothetical protein
MEDGIESTVEGGTPQGSTISPLLANVYLHYSFDLWAQQWRKKHCRGEMIIVRYADDFAVGFQHESDARWFLADLRKRLQKFSLELHPEKTRLIEFGRFALERREKRGQGKPETFDFLGFCHICGTTKKGRFALRRHTIKSRMRAKLKEVKDQLRRRRHLSIPIQGKWLRSVLKGYFAYYAVPSNSSALESFRKQVGRHWLRSLRRRSQRSRITWERMSRLIERWFPTTRILHPWPQKRFNARTRGRSPVR